MKPFLFELENIGLPGPAQWPTPKMFKYWRVHKWTDFVIEVWINNERLGSIHLSQMRMMNVFV